MQRGADVLQGVPPFALAQGVDFLFRGFQNFGGGAHLFGHHVRNLHGSLTQPPEHSLLLDDPGVPAHVHGSGGDVHELDDVVPGVVVVAAQLLHLVQHGHRVDGLGEIEHGVHGFKNLPVLLQVEVLRLHRTHHVGDAAAVDEDGTQNRLLRLQGMGHLAPC